MRHALLLALLPAAVMAQEPCYDWREATAVSQPAQPVNTSPKRVKKQAKIVHVPQQVKKPPNALTTPRPNKAKRKSAVPSVGTTKPLPTLVRVPVACPARPPVTEVFLPSSVKPSQPILPGLLPPSMPYSPYVGHTPVPTAPATPPEWFAGPLAVIPPGGFANDEQSNDLPLFPPNGYVETPGSIPAPGTLLLLAFGAVAIWRMR